MTVIYFSLAAMSRSIKVLEFRILRTPCSLRLRTFSAKVRFTLYPGSFYERFYLYFSHCTHSDGIISYRYLSALATQGVGKSV